MRTRCPGRFSLPVPEPVGTISGTELRRTNRYVAWGAKLKERSFFLCSSVTNSLQENSVLLQFTDVSKGDI